MSIVVAHSPDLAVTSEMAYQGGKGQYNQWLAQFKQQQENAKTQALLGGFGAGGRLGLGIAGMRQRERSQKAAAAARGAKMAQQATDDKNFSQTMGHALFDAAADRYPLQPDMWSQVMKWPKAQQESLLKWSNGIRTSRTAQGYQSGPTQVNANVAGHQADARALGMGSDNFKQARTTLTRLHSEGKIDDSMLQKGMDRINRNAARYGNPPKRPETPAETIAGDSGTRQSQDGTILEGHYEIGPNGRRKWVTDHEVDSPFTRDIKRMEAMGKAAQVLPNIEQAIDQAKDDLKGRVIANPELDEAGDVKDIPSNYEPVDEYRRREIEEELRIFKRARRDLISKFTEQDTGNTQDLPVLTQEWIQRISSNPNLTRQQKSHLLMLQKVHPQEYVMDRVMWRPYRQGAWDNGDPNRERYYEAEVQRGRLGRGGNLSMHMTPEQLEDPSRGMDPPPPPMARDQQFGEPEPVDPVTDLGLEERRRLGLVNESGQKRYRGELMPRLEGQTDEQINSLMEHQRQTRLLMDSAGARRVAVKEARSQHIKVLSKKTPSIKGRTERSMGMKQPEVKKVKAFGDVDAMVPIPRGLSSESAAFEVDLDRLYNDFPTVADRTEIRYVQSMLRKFGYDLQKVRAHGSPSEIAAWDDAMKRIKQLRATQGRKR
jgi:hypothetical protein